MGTKKPTTKTNTIKFFTVVGNSRIGGCIENSNYEQVFKTRREAAKFIADEVNDFIDQEELEDRPKETAKSCMNGCCFYQYNDDDDCIELDIVEHRVPADFFKG
jgi:hypothetical protein